MTFDLKTTRKVFKFEDRRVGDMLIVATARGPSQAVQTPHSFVEFQALQTSQGIAIVPIADDLIVAAAPDNVVVSRQDGLMLSGRSHGNAVSGGILASTTALPAVMEFAAWREAPGRSFIERRQYHLDRLAAATAQEIGTARFDYAKFLLGYGLAPEALAALNAAAIEDVALVKDAAFRGIEGVAEAMSGRYVDAIRSLSGNGLDNVPHAAGLARPRARRNSGIGTRRVRSLRWRAPSWIHSTMTGGRFSGRARPRPHWRRTTSTARNTTQQRFPKRRKAAGHKPKSCSSTR